MSRVQFATVNSPNTAESGENTHCQARKFCQQTVGTLDWNGQVVSQEMTSIDLEVLERTGEWLYVLYLQNVFLYAEARRKDHHFL